MFGEWDSGNDDRESGIGNRAKIVAGIRESGDLLDT